MNPRGRRGTALDSGVGHLLLHACHQSAPRTQRVCLGPAPRSSALELGLQVHLLGSSHDTYAPDVISNEDTRPQSPAPSQLPHLPLGRGAVPRASRAGGRADGPVWVCREGPVSPRSRISRGPEAAGPSCPTVQPGRVPLLLSARRPFPTETRGDR